MTVSTELARAWEEQRTWSLGADPLKRQLDRWRVAALLLAIAAAALAVAATQLTPPAPTLGRSLATVAAVCAGLATLAQRRVSSERIQAWTGSRAASEAVKSEVWSYLAGGSAYADAGRRDQVLRERVQAVAEEAAALQRHTLRLEPDGRPLPVVRGLSDYLAQRVHGQVRGFYRPKAALYDRRVRRLRATGDVLGVLTVVLAAVAASFELPSLTAWVPVVTTTGTSLVAHAAASRYDQLVVEYLRTARRLEHLGSSDPATAVAADLVDACEAVICGENRAWAARWTTPEEGGSG